MENVELYIALDLLISGLIRTLRKSWPLYSNESRNQKLWVLPLASAAAGDSIAMLAKLVAGRVALISNSTVALL
ncbi:MAG: hypothetical protein EBV06_17520 [Planctomycetia bacterium]|nr:hypothetical protein [Planctomycetia bacterium]